ncbi:Tungstate-binding protein TupA [Candidatus Entotheonellaceae bacterium PAL068K]
MVSLAVMRVLLCCHAVFGQAPVPREIILATTTSTQDSGLLDALLPLFETKTGYRVKTIAIGTGQALAMAARGDADVVLAHAPTLEKRYVAQGSILNRRRVMYNDFILVGPAADPVQIKGLQQAAKALKRVADAQARFVSRGDNSGTHFLEKRLWQAADIEPQGRWYIEVGQGMGATLLVASEKGAYTLTDRGTFLSLKKHIQLVPVVEGDQVLLNIYSVMEVNPDRFPRINHAGAKAFADFLLTSETQMIIKTFGTDKFGQPLFFPNTEPQKEARSRIQCLNVRGGGWS